MTIFSHWKAKLGSLVLAILFYMYLQNSKIQVKTVHIPVEYPKLSGNFYISKSDKTIPVKLEGNRDMISYYSQLLKAVVEPQDFQPGENVVQSFRITGVPNGLRVIRQAEKLHVVVDIRGLKQVLLEPVFDDELPLGFIKSSHFLKPSKILVSGPQASIDKLNKIFLPPVSLKDKKESFSKNIKLSELPKGVTLAGKVKDIVLRVNIIGSSSNTGEQLVSGIAIKCVGLDEALDAELGDEEVAIKYNSSSPVKSIDVIRGITATVPCNYIFDKKEVKILPNANPVATKVRILKSPSLKNLEILQVLPDKITIRYKIRPEFDKRPKKDTKDPDLELPDKDSEIETEDQD